MMQNNKTTIEKKLSKCTFSTNPVEKQYVYSQTSNNSEIVITNVFLKTNCNSKKKSETKKTKHLTS